LWISSVDKLWRMSPDGSRTSRVLPVSHDHYKLVAAAASIYRDRGGVIWIGTNGYGLLRYAPHVERFRPTYGGSVRWMSPSRDRRVLAWPSRPQRCELATHRLTDFDMHTSHTNGELIGALFAVSMVQDSRGIIWSNHLDLKRPPQENGARTRPGLAPNELHYL